MTLPQQHRYTLDVDPRDRQTTAAQFWMAGAVGIWEQPAAVVGWFADPTDAVPAGGNWAIEPDVDWQAGWKASIEPVIAGPVAIVPTWLADTFTPPAGVQTIVVLDPGQAFGSGHHATTTLCTEYLAEQDLTGRTVFDVGTGTGVLAIVAALRGAGPICAVDIDHHAVQITRDNAAAMGLDDRTEGFDIQHGSADHTTTVIEGDVFEVVVANLVTDVITALADQLAARVAPGGILITSGIDAQRADRPRAALAATGLQLVESRVQDGWAGDLWFRAATAPDPSEVDLAP